LLDAAIYGLTDGSLMSAFPFNYLFHTIADYLTFLKPLTLIRFKDAADGWALDVSLSVQETCGMLDYFVSRD
jgi:hypothetical protein